MQQEGEEERRAVACKSGRVVTLLVNLLLELTITTKRVDQL